MKMDAIILAAGLSERMGRNKLLLPFHGRTVLNAVIERALPFADRIIVVTGHEREAIEGSISSSKVLFAYNESYRLGQKSSVLRGIIETEEEFFILPGDLPMVMESDIEKTLLLLSKKRPARCFYNALPAHPVAFRKEDRDKLLSYPGPFKKYLEEVGYEIHQGSIGSAFDADTLLRYESLLTGKPDPALL